VSHGSLPVAVLVCAVEKYTKGIATPRKHQSCSSLWPCVNEDTWCRSQLIRIVAFFGLTWRPKMSDERAWLRCWRRWWCLAVH